MANARVDWGEFEYDGQNLLFSGHARMPPEQLPSFLLTADGDDRPHAWWVAQTKLYELRTTSNPSVREMRDMLAQAIKQNRLAVPEVLREAERNAGELMRLYSLREAFNRRHRDATAHATPAVSPTTPSRTSSPRPTQSSPGAMSLHNMVAHQTLMSMPLAAPVPVPGPTPHALPLFPLIPHRAHGGIPVPAPGPNPPPLVPAYAPYAAYTTRPAPTPPTQHTLPMDEDPDPGSPTEVDELADEDKAAAATTTATTATDPQPDRPKKRSRPTRAHPSSPRVCTTCARTDSPEWRRGPHGPKTLCNACGLKWAKASGAGRRRGGQANTNEWRGEAFSSNVQSPASRPGTADPFQGPPPTSAPLASSTSLPVSTNLPSSLAPPPSSSLPSSLVGSSAPVIAVPPNPRSPVGSHSPDVKVETDAPSGLMDLATVAALESGRTDEPQSQSLKRPRADSSYNGLGRYDRPPSSRTPSSTRGYPEPYTPAYPDKPYSESATRPYSDSSRTYSSSGSEGAGGVRPINVIPIGSYRD
ncbi:GATA type zinc finger [Rhizoctonia solani]|uniref:GATA type zinc finger n=2 Tax=Rhizoctonia solani TaxID=456999 RepID=A0A8H8NYV2_9AGAM|nr:GATA type zinc finger [Rhizoctonia solani]QRW21180.1 GATA type zinc finger [Rhizoctonia solani]